MLPLNPTLVPLNPTLVPLTSTLVSYFTIVSYFNSPSFSTIVSLTSPHYFLPHYSPSYHTITLFVRLLLKDSGVLYTIGCQSYHHLLGQIAKDRQRECCYVRLGYSGSYNLTPNSLCKNDFKFDFRRVTPVLAPQHWCDGLLDVLVKELYIVCL